MSRTFAFCRPDGTLLPAYPAGPADRGRARVYEPDERDELARQYLEHAPGTPARS